MNSMEAVVRLCTTLQRIEEDSAKFHEDAFAAKHKGKWVYIFSFVLMSLNQQLFCACIVLVSCTLPSAATAHSAKVYKSFVDEATQAASSACNAAEEAANVVINISKEMMDAEKAAQRANLLVRLQVSSSYALEILKAFSLCPVHSFVPCFGIDPNIRR